MLFSDFAIYCAMAAKKRRFKSRRIGLKKNRVLLSHSFMGVCPTKKNLLNKILYKRAKIVASLTHNLPYKPVPVSTSICEMPRMTSCTFIPTMVHSVASVRIRRNPWKFELNYFRRFGKSGGKRTLTNILENVRTNQSNWINMEILTRFHGEFRSRNCDSWIFSCWKSLVWYSSYIILAIYIHNRESWCDFKTVAKLHVWYVISCDISSIVPNCVIDVIDRSKNGTFVRVISDLHI